MTKKDMKKVEEVVEKMLRDLLFEDEEKSVIGYEDQVFPMMVLQEMEEFLGHPIDFMGIS